MTEGRSCENKLSYHSYDEAIAAKILAKEHGEQRVLRPYRCREGMCRCQDLASGTRLG